MKQQNKLIYKIKKGNKEALDIFIKQNLNLVIHIAKDYMGRGVELEDLIQEGTIGLCNAIYKFNPSISPNFSMYAGYWIRKNLGEAVQKNARLVYLPEYINKRITHLKYVVNKLTIRLNRYPTLEEIIEESGFSYKEITKLYNNILPPISTNQKLDCLLDEDEMILEDLIISKDPTLDEQIEEKEKTKKLLELLDTSNLTDIEIKILKLRYGFYNDIIYTYKEIGNALGVTPQDIHYHVNTAIKKIKRNKRFLELALYLDKSERVVKEIENNLDTKKIKVKKHSNSK